MSAALTNKNTDVKAGVGQAQPVDVTGSLFVCKESTARFMMQFNDGEKFPCEPGFSFRPPGGFSRVTFYNLGTDLLTIDWYAGDTWVNYNSTRIPRTRSKGGFADIGAEASQEYAGVDTGNRRKQIIVTNSHATQQIYLLDLNSGDPMLIVYPKTVSSPIETDADLAIYNPATFGSGIVTRVYTFEIFYTT